MTVKEILEENARRRAAISHPYDPVAGDPADGERFCLDVKGLAEKPLWLPVAMEREPLCRRLREAGALDEYIKTWRHQSPNPGMREMVKREFRDLRMLHDFPYWAATCAYIKRKGGGDDHLFVLNRPQRHLVAAFEEQRCAGKPIRLILLKARQWGGSTCTQLYMCWLQLIHREGLNSLIIAHQSVATDEIKDMFDRMITSYPEELLYPEGRKKGDKVVERVGRSGAAFRIVSRNCKVKVASAERPDSCRGGDYNLVHCSEVGIWKATKGKAPEQILRSACSGVLYEPLTMIVYESTANGTGNFFHREYEAAKRGESQYKALFIPWYLIDQYSLPLENEEEFAEKLLRFKDAEVSTTDRAQPGRYLWLLWEHGATLEAINWYVMERSKYGDHGLMAAEYPSDDVEAFVHSGARVFDKYKVEALRRGCRPPLYIGEVVAQADSGPGALRNLHFVDDACGCLAVWALPDESPIFSNRYLTVVDIGGRSLKADWSVVCVFDRKFMASGGRPVVVAQWRGHTDMDLLAWNALRIAAFYHKSLLVIESNTLETRDADRMVDGDQTPFILNQLRNVYPNLYARQQDQEDILRGMPRKYGFHTNVRTKPMVISMLVKVIREGLYAERDERCLDECLCYEQRPNGSYGAIPGRHDDLLMTRAIGLYICYQEMPLPAKIRSSAHCAQRKSIPSLIFKSKLFPLFCYDNKKIIITLQKSRGSAPHNVKTNL